MFATDFITQLAHAFAAELDHLAGGDADEVIVGNPTGYDFKIGLLVVKKNLFKDAGILQVVQGAIDGGAADLVAGLAQFIGERFSLEKSIASQDCFKDQGTFRSELEFGAMEVTAKNGAKRFVRSQGRDLGYHAGKTGQHF